MNRVGGKCFAPDASTEHHMRQDTEIWKDGPGATTSVSPNVYEYLRSRIAETVSCDVPTGPDGYSRNCRN